MAYSSEFELQYGHRMFWATTTLLLIAAGLFCVAAGYWLFCESPALRRSVTIRRLFWGNIVPGALLALFGTGLVTVQTRSLLAHRPDVRRHAPAAQDTSWPKLSPRQTRDSSV